MIAAVVSSLLPLVAAVGPCAYETKDKKLTYSLDAVSLKSAADGAFYEIPDAFMQNRDGGTYAYIFNVCGAVQSTPKKPSDGTDRCTPTGGTAYQVSLDYGFCYPVGVGSEARGTNTGGETGVQMGLLTHYDSDADLNRRATGMTDASQMTPASGFYYKLFGGGSCGNVQRSMMLKFICSENKLNAMPARITATQAGSGQRPAGETKHRVVENGACQYETEIFSSVGCPTQCPVIGNKVCGDHGICGWDYEMKVARCMCNSGWGGSSGMDCQSTFVTPPTPFNLEYVGIALVLIVLCGILGTLGYVGTCLFRIKKKQGRVQSGMGGSGGYGDISNEDMGIEMH
jgi:hypothetical protein